MSVVKMALLAGGMSVVLATAAFPQPVDIGKAEGTDQWNLDSIPEGTGVILATTVGAKATRMKIGRRGHALLLSARAAIELPARTMIYRKDGKFYLVGDKKMPDNSMLFDKTKGWERD
ncbi:MAG: hypothetical protein ACREDY_28255 [Bradyrhizobium sp.]